jgi:pyruvate/2-oxoglutarate dehydrogenase complex dihydrolipoamide dehydrogenase (E3) component
MVERLNPDICVIGGGSGGLSVAAAAAAFGVPVVLVEQGKMGGDCLNTGCVPSKSLIAAARRARVMSEAKAFGITADAVRVDYKRVYAHVHEVIAAIAPNDSKERFTGLGVRVIEGKARFKDRKTVVVGDIEITARRVVIAAGSSPAQPNIPGLDSVPFLTSDTVFDLAVCPDHLVVIGGGPIGLELGQAFRRLGSAVTILDAAEPLAGEDPECAQFVRDELAREGIALRSGVKIARVESFGSKVHAVLDTASKERIDGSHLLVATGRRPNLGGLGLEQAGIKFDAHGIAVDKRLRTTNPHVYAIGDIAGGPQFTHAANYHAGLVIRNALFRLPVKVNNALIPRVTFTDPELAHVGLTEAQARSRGYSIGVARWPYHENDRAQAERETVGHIKVITSRRGKILGVTIVGAAAGELITTWTLALERNMNIRALTGIVVPYPTLAEIGKRAAVAHFAPRLTSPMVRRIIAFLRRFG